MIKAVWRYLRRVLKALDRFLNAIAGGSDRDTISARAGRARLAGAAWGCVLCRLLDLFQRDHCDLALNDTLEIGLGVSRLR